MIDEGLSKFPVETVAVVTLNFVILRFFHYGEFYSGVTIACVK